MSSRNSPRSVNRRKQGRALTGIPVSVSLLYIKGFDTFLGLQRRHAAPPARLKLVDHFLAYAAKGYPGLANAPRSSQDWPRCGLLNVPCLIHEHAMRRSR